MSLSLVRTTRVQRRETNVAEFTNTVVGGHIAQDHGIVVFFLYLDVKGAGQYLQLDLPGIVGNRKVGSPSSH